MTKKEFLYVMDNIKERLVSNGYTYSCHIIRDTRGSSSMYNLSLLREYTRIFDLDYNPTFFHNSDNVANKNYHTTRIAAIELFEIISLEKKLYLKY